MLIETSTRYCMSANEVANLANSLLVDLKVMDPSMYLDAEKIRRMKETNGKKLEAKHLEKCSMKCIGFDGKKVYGVSVCNDVQLGAIPPTFT